MKIIKTDSWGHLSYSFEDGTPVKLPCILILNDGTEIPLFKEAVVKQVGDWGHTYDVNTTELYGLIQLGGNRIKVDLDEFEFESVI